MAIKKITIEILKSKLLKTHQHYNKSVILVRLKLNVSRFKLITLLCK